MRGIGAVVICGMTVMCVSIGCVSSAPQSTHQGESMSRAMLLSPGMSKEQVLATIGSPVKTEFDRGVAEWHYCKTGKSVNKNVAVDEFLVLFFQGDNLIAMRNYTVSSVDEGFYGSCEKGVKRGDYRVPDAVTEIRLRGLK
jgi:outer membrane protein assembly factor BamE (lipoprotein component of BamABCDE complex)